MKQKTFLDWVIATRPWSFPAGTMPVIVTVAYLYVQSRQDSFTLNWLNAALALLGMVLFQAAGNLLSDYADYRKGVDRTDTVCVKTLVSGLFTLREVKRFGLIILVLATAIGLYLCVVSGPWLLAIGAIGVLTTAFYPYLKYHALGDLVIFIDYAVLPMLGTTLVVVGRFCPDALILALPVGLITVAILHINNTRDIHSDARAGIMTLSIRLGHDLSIALYCFELLFPYLFLLFAVCLGRLLPVTSLCVLLSLPLAILNARVAFKGLRTPSMIAHLDEATAQLQMAFSLTLSLGLCLSAWWS